MKFAIIFALVLACVSAQTYTVSMVTPTVLSITLTTSTTNNVGVAWRSSVSGATATPHWGVVCSAAVCISVTCTGTASSTCSAATGDNFTYTPGATGTLVITRNTSGTGLGVTPGDQVAVTYTTTYASSAAPAVADTWTWAQASGSAVTLAAYTAAAAPFTVTMAQTATATVSVTMTPAAGRYGALGFPITGTIVPSYLVACDASLSTGVCAAFTCSIGTGATIGQTTCAAAATAVTGAVVAGTPPAASFTLTPGSGSVPAIAVGAVTAVGYATTSTAATPTATNVQDNLETFVQFSATLTAFQGTAPTFTVAGTYTSATAVAITITTNANKYAVIGVGELAAGYPSTVAVCEPKTLTSCGIYSCTSASACTAQTATGYSSTVTASSSSAVITVPVSALPTTNPYWYWLEPAIPSGGLTLAPTLVQGQTWNLYKMSLSQVSTVPTFPITFSAPSATTIAVTLVPGSGQTGLFGWRSTSASAFPADVIVCAPSSVTTCLDVTCTSASACSVRTPTIYTVNTASGTTASVTRPLAAGAVTLEAGKQMNLAWAVSATASGTTTLSATAAQGVTWNYYTATTPTTGTSSAITLAPALVAAIAALALLAF